jgi:glycosyltransferase involved in cell wall biosynthesis
MRIVLCLSHFMPQQTAGTEVYTLALGKALQASGHEVTVVIPNYDTTVGDEYFFEGLRVKRYAEPNHIDKALVNGKRPPDGIKAFEALLKELNPQIVHLQELAGSSGIGIYHLRRMKRMHIKIVFTMHLARYSCFTGSFMYKGIESCGGIIDIKKCTECSLSKYPIHPLLKKTLSASSLALYNLKINTGSIAHSAATALSFPFIINDFKKQLFEVVDLCEYVIVLSEWYQEVLLANGIPGNKLKLVKQALPLKAPAMQRATKEVIAPIQLVYIGRINPEKGLYLLLGAIKDLDEQKIAVYIYGSAKDEAYLNRLKDSVKGKGNIFWKGPIAQQNVISTISRYDALVIPSATSEMSPLVIQEAFAAGVPVIGSNVAGIAEQVEEGKTGLLFTFLNEQSLKEKLLFLIQNPLYLRSLQKNILPPNEFETVVAAYFNIYKELIPADFASA